MGSTDSRPRGGRAKSTQRNDALPQATTERGTIDSFQVVVLEPHGGDLASFVLVKGDKETVAQLRVSGEFVQLIARMQLVHSKVGVIGARTGAEVRALFKMWDQQSEDLT